MTLLETSDYFGASYLSHYSCTYYLDVLFVSFGTEQV